MRSRHLRITASLAASLLLAACQSDPATGPTAYVGPVHEIPQLEERFFPDDPTTPRGLRIGGQLHLEPCQLLPATEAARVFALGEKARQRQYFLHESAPLNEITEEVLCHHVADGIGEVAVYVRTFPTPQAADAYRRGAGWAPVGTPPGPLTQRQLTDGDDTTDDLPVLAVAKPYGAQLVEVQVKIGSISAAQAVAQAQTAFTVIDRNAARGAALPQGPVDGPLGDETRFGESVYVPGCHLLSRQIVDDLTGGYQPFPTKLQNLPPRDTDNGIATHEGQPRLPGTGCYWESAAELPGPGGAWPEDAAVGLRIGFAQDAADAREGLDLDLRERRLDLRDLEPVPGIGIEAGGYSDEGYEGYPTWFFQTGPYVGFLTVEWMEAKAPREYTAEDGREPLAAIIQRLRRLRSEAADG